MSPLAKAFHELIVNLPEHHPLRIEALMFEGQNSATQEILVKRALRVACGTEKDARIGERVSLPPAPARTAEQLFATYKRLRRITIDHEGLPEVHEVAEMSYEDKEHWVQIVSDRYLEESDRTGQESSRSLDEIFLAEIGGSRFPTGLVGPMVYLSEQITQMRQLAKRFLADATALEERFVEVRNIVRRELEAKERAGTGP